MITNYGFIYVDPGADAAGERAVRDSDAQRSTIVAVPEPAAVVDAAARLADEGAQLIELCGFFGPTWTARVVEAVGDRVAVGSVSFGPESVGNLAAAVAAPAGD